MCPVPYQHDLPAVVIDAYRDKLSTGFGRCFTQLALPIEEPALGYIMLTAEVTYCLIAFKKRLVDEPECVDRLHLIAVF